jgi:hypothetical protein
MVVDYGSLRKVRGGKMNKLELGILIVGIVFGFMGAYIYFEIGTNGQLSTYLKLKQECPDVLENEWLCDFCENCRPEDYQSSQSCEILCEKGLPRCEPCVGDYPYFKSEVEMK